MKTAVRIALWAAICAAGTASAGPAEDDRFEIVRRMADFVGAWNRHDAKAMASFWVEDGDLVDVQGRHAEGREAIEALLKEEHAENGPFARATLSFHVDSVRFVTKEVAVCDWETRLKWASHFGGKAMSVRVTVVVKKVGETWGCVAARPSASKAVPDLERSRENVSELIKYFIASEVGLSRPWPSFNGKRFVLWLVATNHIDRRSPKDLELLFSPGDAKRGVEMAGGPEAYDRVTLDALKSEGGDYSMLTSYAGRRNREKPHLLTSSELVQGAAVIADLSFPDGAIVGFSGGEVKWMTREELGIPAGRPITVGEDSPSELLRHLSDK